MISRATRSPDSSHGGLEPAVDRFDTDAVALLQNAASIASLLLTTETIVCEIPDEKADNAMGGGMSPGKGMY